MKASSTSNQRPQKSSGSGIVQIAIWKDNPETVKMQDVFSVYSNDVFFDFARPLRILDGPGWSPMISAGSDEGFFVFSTTEKNLF